MQEQKNQFNIREVIQSQDTIREISGILVPNSFQNFSHNQTLKLATDWCNLHLKFQDDLQENYENYLWKEVKVRGKYSKQQREITVTSICSIEKEPKSQSLNRIIENHKLKLRVAAKEAEVSKAS